ncbi:c-type cytochrome [Enterobacteriaceae bacterium RIT691]|nr:c-type cytochrome [Enterobacteriaceae bacterium RIT691]
MRTGLIIAGLLFCTASHAAPPSGEYVARVADCMACHTAAGGEANAGGKKFSTPVGDIYSTNITPDKTHGIGNYTYADFEKAVRQGIAKDGHPLYPAMPYPSYAKMSDQDIRALYDYFMHDVPPSATANRESDIPWLLSARWPLHIWNALFTDSPSGVRAGDDELLKRGAYLVEGPGHCGACHTPRGVAMQEKAYDDSSPAFLSGAMIDGWYAPSLRSLNLPPEELKALLLTGRSKHAAISGSMGEVIEQSTQYLTDDDANAIVHYLLSLNHNGAAPSPEPTTPGTPSNLAGQTLYMRYCSTCHGPAGQGTEDNVPSLSGNPMVQVADPTPLIRVIAQGAETPNTKGNPSFRMPAYGDVLSDDEIRDVTNFVKESWGNGAPETNSDEVAKAKKGEQ